MAPLRHLEAVLVRVVLAEVRQHLSVLLVPGVADALEEKQREDVRLPVGTVDRAAAQDVRGLPEVGLEVRERERGRRGERELRHARRSLGVIVVSRTFSTPACALPTHSRSCSDFLRYRNRSDTNGSARRCAEVDPLGRPRRGHRHVPQPPPSSDLSDLCGPRESGGPTPDHAATACILPGLRTCRT